MREQVRFEDGRVATATWDDYPILRFSDIPEIEIELIDNPNEPTLGPRRSLGRPDRGRHRQRARPRARASASAICR